MRVGAAILQHRGGTGSLLGVVEVARGQPISRGITVACRYRRLLNRITAIGESSRAVFGVEVRVAHNLALGIREAVYEVGADLLVLEWPGLSVRPGVSSVIASLVSDPPADLVLVRPDPDPENGDRGILVPIRGGPSARLALQVADALAAAEDLALNVLHVYRPQQQAERRRREEAYVHQLADELRHPVHRLIEGE